MGNQSPMRDLGACAVVFGSTTIVGGTVGESHGGVHFKTSQDVAPVHEDVAGSQPVDEIFTGEACEVSVPLTRFQLATLVSLMPGSSGSGTTGNTMVVRSTVGRSAYDNAQKLIIKPIVNGAVSTNSNEWLTVFKASPRISDADLVYDVSTQRVINIVFKGFKVRANGVGEKIGWLYKIG